MQFCIQCKQYIYCLCIWLHRYYCWIHQSDYTYRLCLVDFNQIWKKKLFWLSHIEIFWSFTWNIHKNNGVNTETKYEFMKKPTTKKKQRQNYNIYIFNLTIVFQECTFTYMYNTHIDIKHLFGYLIINYITNFQHKCLYF